MINTNKKIIKYTSKEIDLLYNFINYKYCDYMLKRKISLYNNANYTNRISNKTLNLLEYKIKYKTNTLPKSLWYIVLEYSYDNNVRQIHHKCEICKNKCKCNNYFSLFNCLICFDCILIRLDIIKNAYNIRIIKYPIWICGWNYYYGNYQMSFSGPYLYQKNCYLIYNTIIYQSRDNLGFYA